MYICKVLTAVFMLVFATSACTTVKREYPLPNQAVDAARINGLARVVFYNDTNVALFPASNRIGIKLDGKGVAAPYAGEYVQIDIPHGEHQLELSHFDVFYFADDYSLTVAGDLYLRVYATPFATKFESRKVPPGNFGGFRPTSD